MARTGASLVLISQSDQVFVTANKLKALTDAPLVAYQTDISSHTELKLVFDSIHEEFKRVDVLVNNAAIMGPTGPMMSNDIEEWARVLQVNILGTVNAIKFVLPGMKALNSGSIINFSGGGAASPSPNFSAYGTSKAAIVRLTETLSEELIGSSIRVNVIAPGANDTDMLACFIQAGGKARTVVTLDKPVNLVLWLASDKSFGISGKFIHVHDEYRTFTPDNVKGELFTLRRIEP